MPEAQLPDIAQRLLEVLRDGPADEVALLRLADDRNVAAEALRDLVARGAVRQDHLMTQPPRTRYRLNASRSSI